MLTGELTCWTPERHESLSQTRWKGRLVFEIFLWLPHMCCAMGSHVLTHITQNIYLSKTLSNVLTLNLARLQEILYCIIAKIYVNFAIKYEQHSFGLGRAAWKVFIPNVATGLEDFWMSFTSGLHKSFKKLSIFLNNELMFWKHLKYLGPLVTYRLPLHCCWSCLCTPSTRLW